MDADLAVLRAFFARAPFMADLGIEPFECEPGRVRTRMAVQPRHLQHSGVVHAAVLGTMAHHTMGAAAQTMTDRLFLPAEFKFILLRVAHGHRLECHEPRSSPVAC